MNSVFGCLLVFLSMNHFVITVFAAGIFLAVSCGQKEKCGISPVPVPDSNAIAVEIIENYQLLSYDRPIDVNSDARFIDSEIAVTMKDSKFYRSLKEVATKAGTRKLDTLKYSQQIPFCANIKDSTLIYLNGLSEHYQATDLDPQINPLLCLHDSELDLSHCVARLEIKNGKARSYNNRGILLSEQTVEMPDYTGFLAELARCQSETEAETKSGTTKRDIHWLKAKMNEESLTKGLTDESYRIYSEGDIIILEQIIHETKSGDAVMVRTLLSSDLSRNYGYEQLENGYLKAKCTNTFDSSHSSSIQNRGLSAHGGLEERPVRTVVEELSFLRDGTPMIKVSDKQYTVNTVRINF